VDIADRQVQIYELFERRLRPQIRALVTPELVAEHEARPGGPHSDSLQRVMNYLRRQPMPGKYVIVAVRPWEEYRIGVLSGVRGQTARVLDDERFASEEEAMHGIFLRRIRDLDEALARDGDGAA
jgi:hypothetical protein